MLLITGAMGFIGSHLRKKALASGLVVIATARKAAVGINHVGDLRDAQAVQRLPIQEITALIHCAAAIPSRSKAFVEDNEEAAGVLVAALEKADSLRRVVHLSSVAVYNQPRTGTLTLSEDAPMVRVDDDDVNPYARSKRLAELAFDALAAKRAKVKVVHLRPSSIYGHGMVKSTLLPAVVGKAARNEPILLRGSRDHVQNFVHVEDVADLALMLAREGAPAFSAINAFSDDTYGLFALVRLVLDRLRSSSPIIDQTNDSPAAALRFVNNRAKTLHSGFRALRDHLEDAL